MNWATSEQLCTLLDQMIWARCATEQARPRHRVRLHALPPTMWIRPARGVGGHKAARTGTLPATIDWRNGALHAADPATGRPVSAGWSVDAAGTHLAGAIDLTEGHTDLGRPTGTMWPAHRAPVLSAYQATRLLDEFIERGELARWTMLAHLEQYAQECVHQVAASICREITGIEEHETAVRLLDDQQLDLVSSSPTCSTALPARTVEFCVPWTVAWTRRPPGTSTRSGISPPRFAGISATRSASPSAIPRSALESVASPAHSAPAPASSRSSTATTASTPLTGCPPPAPSGH